MGMRKLRSLPVASLFGAAALCGAVVLGQSFEVASVRPAAPNARFGNMMQGGPGTDDPGRFTATNASLLVLLTRAFGVNPDQLTAPDWAGATRLDIAATLPAAAFKEQTTKEQLNVMLRNLLAERLHMTYHTLKKDFPAYNLTVAAGGPKLTPTDGKTGGAAVMIRASCTGDHVIAHNKDMAGVAQALRAATGARVIDKTGLTGNYDVDLYVGIDHSSNGMMRCGDQPLDAPAPIEAVEKQLGLKLEKTRVMLDVIVIDRLDKAPAAN